MNELIKASRIEVFDNRTLRLAPRPMYKPYVPKADRLAYSFA